MLLVISSHSQVVIAINKLHHYSRLFTYMLVLYGVHAHQLWTNFMTLRPRLEVTQGHWKLYPGFLFVFYSNYGCILYNFWDKAIYWSKITIFAAWCYASTAYAVMWCLSVCMSVHPSRSWILSKRISISSKLFYHRVATPFLFFRTKRHGNIPMGDPPNGHQVQVSVGTNRDCPRTAGCRLMTAGRANNKCANPLCSSSHRWRCISESMFITACSMHDHDEENRTEFICTQR